MNAMQPDANTMRKDARDLVYLPGNGDIRYVFTSATNYGNQRRLLFDYPEKLWLERDILKY
ncbi:hypothetical protein [Paraburkholderia dinghuensis]|uniref:Uncharacterized protein n=1 Tax=Paraburkholderia dinghuensis TaxID=2305225 RepID=A0A3N6NEM9_9BURK|nr:hypothetical protein [Paraburkholderia dinghuensis]RQH07027.1 hypothetical protein D1Y85_10135 [Paraburkholderia dinghuensis]